MTRTEELLCDLEEAIDLLRAIDPREMPQIAYCLVVINGIVARINRLGDIRPTEAA